MEILPFLAQPDDLQVISIFVLDPLDALELGIHDEGPALRVAQDGGVLDGHAVTRQALVAPSCDVSIVCQQCERVQALCDGDGHLGKRWNWQDQLA